MTVFIHHYNNVNIRIDTTRDILQELSEYFSFFADNYRFNPKFKAKIWDGKVRKFSVNTGLINRGLLSRVVEFCTERGYEYKIDAELSKTNDITLDEVQSFVTSLEFSSKGSPITLRDYQIDAIHKCLTDSRLTVQSPTSSGKSAVIAGIARYLQQSFDPVSEKILIIVPNISLVSQFAYDFCDYFSRDIAWLKSDPVHMIFAGKDKNTDSPIIVSTYQSLAKLPKEWFESVRCLIVDEAHGAESNSIIKIHEKCINAQYRFGFTGSLKSSKLHVLNLEGIFGRVYTTITTKELMENSQVSELEIKALVLKYPAELCKKMRQINDYNTELETIIGSPKRNRFISKLALKQNGCGLILVNRIDQHAKPLFEMIKEMAGDRPVYYISGEVDGDERERIRLSLIHDITIEMEDGTIRNYNKNDVVKLSNNTTKLAKYLTEDDDIM